MQYALLGQFSVAGGNENMQIGKALMTNRSSWKTNDMFATLPWLPGLLTSVIALSTLGMPSVQKWKQISNFLFLQKNKKL